jgi:hypothetical protein
MIYLIDAGSFGIQACHQAEHKILSESQNSTLKAKFSPPIKLSCSQQLVQEAGPYVAKGEALFGLNVVRLW